MGAELGATSHIADDARARFRLREYLRKEMKNRAVFRERGFECGAFCFFARAGLSRRIRRKRSRRLWGGKRLGHGRGGGLRQRRRRRVGFIPCGGRRFTRDEEAPSADQRAGDDPRSNDPQCARKRHRPALA